MDIAKISTDVIEPLPVSELLNYLSQVVLTVVDDQIQKEKDGIEHNKEKLRSKTEYIEKIKQKLDEQTLELSKKQQLKIVLDLIESLSKEGVLVGQNKLKIQKLLDEIEEKDFHTLRSIEQRLSIYRPNI